jgi:2-oxoglutarate ferredoxin oxidoreductase subunit gamma
MILAGIILAEAAGVYDHKNAVQTQTYGPEARGGASKSEVVISTQEIDHPEVICADVLIALSQEAFDRYGADIKPDGLLILDEDKVQTLPSVSAVRVPITRLALEASGKKITANAVALGVLVEITGVVSHQAIEQAVLARAPKGTEEMNSSALLKGFDMARQIKTGISRPT